MFSMSFCGGGALGIGPAYFLSLYEKDYGTNYLKNVNGLAGTSTGSILASGLAIGLSGNQIYELYTKNLKKIFTKYSWYKRCLPKYPTYDNSNLKKILKNTFGDTKVSDIKTNIYIPSFISNRNNSEKVFDNTDNDFLRDVVLYSCSAPTYFSPSGKKENMLDGGLFANDSVACLAAGLHNVNCKSRILSFNTGMKVSDDKFEDEVGDRTLVGWGTYIVKNVVARTGCYQDYIARQIVGEENVMRLEPSVSKSYKMDSVDDETISKIKDNWKDYYLIVKDEVHSFIERQ